MLTLSIFTSVLIMGFACSFGCGTITTPFILGSLLAEGQDIKESRKAIALFSLGKIVSLALMGLLSSLFGAVVLEFIEQAYPNSTVWIVRTLTILFGLWLIYTTVKPVVNSGVSSKQSFCSSCSSCSNCSSSPYSNFLLRKGFYFGAGALYAAIPCAPLVTTLTYASTMPAILAMLLLALFALVNSIVPVLGYASLVGLANIEIAKDAPQYVKYMKLFGGIILIVASFYYTSL